MHFGIPLSPAARGRLAGVACLGVVCAAGFAVGLRGFSTNASAPPSGVAGGSGEFLSVSPAALDFGEVWAAPHFDWIIPVRNVSSRDVQIVGWKPSCGACTSVRPESLVIPAGQSREVTVTLDLTKRGALAGDGTPQPFDVLLVPLIENAPQADLRWQIHGRVRSVATASPPARDFTLLTADPGDGGNSSKLKQLFVCWILPINLSVLLGVCLSHFRRRRRGRVSPADESTQDSARARPLVRRLYTSAALLALVGGAWWLFISLRNNGATPQIKRGQEIPSLQITERELTLGEVWEREDHLHLVTIHNRALQALEIRRLTASCACTSIYPESFTVPARGDRQIELSLNLAAVNASDRSESPRSFSVRLTAWGRDGRSQDWTLTGSLRRAFVAEPSEITYFANERLVHGRESTTKAVEIEPMFPADGLTLDWPRAMASVELHRIQTNPAKYLLSIRPSANLQPGPFEFRICLRAAAGNAHTGGELFIPVRGSVIQLIDASPESIQLQPHLVGAHITTSVTLHSNDEDTTFRVRHVEAGEALTVASAPLDRAFRPTQTLTLTLAAMQVGDRRDKLNCLVQLSDGREVAVRIPVLTYALTSR